MVWSVILVELVKFIVALLAGGAFGVAYSSYDSGLPEKVASSDFLWNAALWMGIGGVLVYAQMSGLGIGGLLRLVFKGVRYVIDSAKTQWELSK